MFLDCGATASGAPLASNPVMPSEAASLSVGDPHSLGARGRRAIQVIGELPLSHRARADAPRPGRLGSGARCQFDARGCG